MASVEERVFSGLIQQGDCWQWTRSCGGTNEGRPGYGKLTVNGRETYVHRWMYEFLIAPIPVGLTIDHLCLNTRCANPWHLEPVTLAENSRRIRALDPVLTHCKQGHEFTIENTYLRPDRRGRICRECVRLRSQAYRARKAAA